MNLDEIRFDEQGLVAAVVQDAYALRRQDDLTTIIRVFDAAFGGALVHRLADL